MERERVWSGGGTGLIVGAGMLYCGGLVLYVSYSLYSEISFSVHTLIVEEGLVLDPTNVGEVAEVLDWDSLELTVMSILTYLEQTTGVIDGTERSKVMDSLQISVQDLPTVTE